LSIFQALLDSKLPESEKSTERLFSESPAAGTDTTGMILTRIFFHLLSNPVALKRLKKELEIAIPDPNILPTFAQVENLPYFVSQFLITIHVITFNSPPSSERYHRRNPSPRWQHAPGTLCAL
jgi:hypothetical protein